MMSHFVVLVLAGCLCCCATGWLLQSPHYQEEGDRQHIQLAERFAEAVITGIAGFFCLYILGTMGLFVQDAFTLTKGAVITAGLSLGGFLISLVKYLIWDNPDKNQAVSHGFHLCRPQHILIPLLVILIGLPFVSMKNELFGMGQDEGVYQCVAINFMNGLTQRQQDFAEYATLDDEAQEDFERAVHYKLVGYDIPSESYPDTVYDREVSPVSGIYHGIPTYAAMLALWGELFGMTQMADIQNLFYVLAVFLVYFGCRNLQLRPCCVLVACVLTALSPMVIWVAKSTLTELFLAVLLLYFLYFLTDKRYPGNAILSILPVMAFSCYHVSIYTLVPYILLVYAGLFFFTHRKAFALLLNLTVPVYLASYLAMCQVQPFYTMNNYRVVFSHGLNVDTITDAIIRVCGIVEAVCIVYTILAGIFARKITLRPDSRFLKWLLPCLTLLPLAYIFWQATAQLESLEEITSLTLTGFFQNAGIVLVPAGVILLLCRPVTFLVSEERLVVFVSFFYCILIYAGFLRFRIEYYDYYARYLVPFIPIAILFAVTALQGAGRKILYPAAVASLLFSMPYADFLRQNRDDTRMEWETLEDIAMHITENDCVVIEDAWLSTLWLPLRAMTKADIYPVLGNHPDAQLQELYNQNSDNNYENIYFIASKSYTYDIDNNLEILYTDTIHCMEDKNIDDTAGMPLAFEAQEKQIYLYSWLQNCRVYPAYRINQFRLYGIGNCEKKFCWTESEYSAMRCVLAKKDYTLHVHLSGRLPLGTLGLEEFPVELSVNGKSVGTQVITGENNGDELVFSIDAQDLQEGSNIIGFHTEMWNASVVNPGDDRTVGIALRSLVFAESK